MAASSTREAYKEARSSVILSTTTFNLSTSIVEATVMKAAIGLDFPILDNSNKAEAAAYGARDLSLGRINSNAATVSSYLTVLLA